jgi:pimeloyl-ACP methyl ester carboxylesterase
MAYGFPDGTIIDAAGVGLATVDRGDGHPVVLVHGFPELAYSWRHQIPALVNAGFRAIAYDQRGFGDSSKPDEVGAYTLRDLIGDYVALLDGLGIDRATLVGHDWGGIVAWAAALAVPERLHSVVSLNVPYRGRCAGFPTIDYIREHLAERFGYVLFFQEPGAAEAWFDADPNTALERFYTSVAGDPGFLDEADFAVYRDAFVAGGITGPINLYRNIDANWKAFDHLADAVVEVPALLLAADADPVLPASLADGMDRWVANLRVQVISGSGHWTQQEQPEAVNRALIEFLDRRA